MLRGEKRVKVWCHFPKKADDVKESKSTSNKLRVLAYLIINKLISNRQTLAEFSARTMYQNFLAQIKTTSVHTLPVIDFMLRTISELYLKDILIESGVTYKHCFLYIRNLALTLRKCITTQQHQEVMTWGFVHSLRLWNLVVAKSGDNLKELIFPITYIAQGAINMEPSLKNLPFRAQINEILLFTMEQTGVFIPMHTFIWPMVTLIDKTVNETLEKETVRTLVKKAKRAKSDMNVHSMEVSWPCMLKFSKVQLEHQLNLGQVVNSVFYKQYSRFLKSQANMIAFVEFFHPVKKLFINYLKTSKCDEFKKQVEILKKGIDAHSDMMGEVRKSIKFNVVDVDKAEVWKLPCGDKHPLNEILVARVGGDEQGGFIIPSDDEDHFGEREKVFNAKNGKKGGKYNKRVEAHKEKKEKSKKRKMDDEKNNSAETVPEKSQKISKTKNSSKDKETVPDKVFDLNFNKFFD